MIPATGRDFLWHGFLTTSAKDYMKYLWLGGLLLWLLSCKDPQKEQRAAEPVPRQVADTVAPPLYRQVHEDTSLALSPPPPKPIKSPSGYFRYTQTEEKTGLEHTIRFHSNHTYHLQQRYRTGEKDSIASEKGTWTPSNGDIWLYKDQVVRGRYRWKGDILHYYQPATKQLHPLQSLPSVMEQPVWKQRAKQQYALFATGTEPFWSVSLSASDTLSFLLADSAIPVSFKLQEELNENGLLVLKGGQDSVQLTVMVQSGFCSDGMSDFMYPHHVEVQLKGQTYKGCGVWMKRK
jgi:uncharacterized membrane protein